MNTPISVFLVTCNEEQALAEVLSSVAMFDEIVVVDSGSTDATVDIAKAHGARVVHQEWLGFAKQKQFAMQACQNEWCFNLDGDEVVPEHVARAIQQQVNSGEAAGLRVFFEDLFLGAPMHPAAHKRSIVRVFQKSKTHYPMERLVHENVRIEGKVARVPGCIIHYGYNDLATYMTKQNRYSSLGAKEKFARGKAWSPVKLVLVLPLMFIKEYFLRKHFLSGFRGLIHASIDAMYAFLKEAKLYELHRQHKTQSK
ncbi:glycosyltransferase family 2 protein [Salinimonas marina]|uniref:Glycosyltransferase family 2 protein n=1 Tax=Salinimonas marina TaxID=2785918 RepID=A0A7S9DWT8_9ALTE|nr:glycosyltransferase family 2 protein [Salinimonas marina]QPG05348.1 glycosyltransferase family 2 protein [Salinimonas marina]